MNDRFTPYIEGSVHDYPRARQRFKLLQELVVIWLFHSTDRLYPGAVVDMGYCRDRTASLIHNFDKVFAVSVSQRLAQVLAHLADEQHVRTLRGEVEVL